MTTLAPSFLLDFLHSCRYQNSNEFEIRPDPTTDYGVSCPENYNVVTTLAPSFLIGSSSFLQVTRTIINAWISSNLAKSDLGLRIKLPLSVLKIPIDLSELSVAIETRVLKSFKANLEQNTMYNHVTPSVTLQTCGTQVSII